MQLLDLPDEVLLIILSYGGFDALSGGPSQCCRRMRELAHDRGLWAPALASLFKEQSLTPEKVDSIPDLRCWYIEQVSIDRTVYLELDKIKQHVLESDSGKSVELIWQVLQYGMRAIHALFQERVVPRSMFHYHWAFWLLRRTYQLEGTRMLMNIYSETNKGMDPIANPFDVLVALFMIKNKNNTLLAMTDLNYIITGSASLFGPAFPLEEVSKKKPHDQLIASVEYVNMHFKSFLDEKCYLVDLAKGSYLMYFVSNFFDWDTKLITVPHGSFVMVDVQRNGKELYFVDFKRDGRLRTLGEIRDQLNFAGVSGKVRYGISLHDILNEAESFQSEDCAERIYCYATKFAEPNPLAYAPHLYEYLVGRVVFKDASHITGCDIQPHLTSQTWGAASFEWLQVGKVVRFFNSVSRVPINRQTESLGDDMTNDTETSEDSEFGVILETNEMSALVLCRNEQRRLSKSELHPGGAVPLVRIAGLLVPDIGANLDILGEYFYSYDVQCEKFV